ncbi:MAG TPA: hypothetical protein VK779_01830 [Rhizomicrobium sp.]|jgi:hypothetical protein|nr:hypothetical protein [Rhizomicrobium sp.]
MQESRFKYIAVASLLAAGTMFAGTAWGGSHSGLGTTGYVGYRPENAQPEAAVPVKPFASFHSASFASGGVALRNRAEGVIQISGATTPIQKAYLYFAYLYQGTPPTSVPITLTRLSPTPSATKVLNANRVAEAADPCWGSSGTAVYRATVPTTVASGNGEYLVQPDASVVGLNNGEDPFDGNVVFPMDEGASLVLIDTGEFNVDLFNHVHEFKTTPYAYTLQLSSTAGSSITFGSIGADGQTGSNDSLGSQASGDTVSVNGTAISGIGSTLNPDSDWDGSAGWPLPQLWDNVAHHITIQSGASTLAVKITPRPDVNKNTDCLVTIANIVSHS